MLETLGLSWFFNLWTELSWLNLHVSEPQFSHTLKDTNNILSIHNALIIKGRLHVKELMCVLQC